MLVLILMVLAFVLFLIPGIAWFRAGSPPSPPAPWPWGSVALGLACWVLAEILKAGTLLSH